MVKHIVMFKFLSEANGKTKRENVLTAAKLLKDLSGKIPALKSCEVKLNSESADKTNYDLVLISEHESWEDLKAYAIHPLHLEVVEFIKTVRESRSCVDYEF